MKYAGKFQIASMVKINEFFLQTEWYRKDLYSDGETWVLGTQNQQKNGFRCQLVPENQISGTQSITTQ